ncbi:hypothetical protein M0R45_007122 [Rubus argutus]|uniref:Co-chaperone protein p23 n=1 Tax=Rubus argutus TaxID=59490 RepID=A0AAW1YT52_RUBAR
MMRGVKLEVRILGPLTVYELYLGLSVDCAVEPFRKQSIEQSRVCVLQMSRQPEVLWAQRSDKVYLTVALPDAKDISIKCEAEGLFSFSAIGVQGEPFHFTLELYGNILPDACKTKAGSRNILCSIQKQHKGWWKRLLKTQQKPAPYIKVDWNHWCDEDDQESTSDLASDDDNAANVGEDDGSSDDEGMLYLPDLEKARRK